MIEQQIHELIEKGTYKGALINGELVETHISWVILTDAFAFKIKKPIQYSFLDFSSLKMRKHYCERELNLNQRLSSIYLDVVPVILSPEGPCFGEGNGEVIDYAVRMERMDHEKKMDLVVQSGEITLDDISRLAEQIAAFHQRADIIRIPFDAVAAKGDFNDLLTVGEWVNEALGEDYHRMILEAVEFSDALLVRSEELLNARIRNGFRRDGHGDLHSKNIFVYDQPVIFDCIEFNDEFRQIDVLNEVAFFCMDLEALGRFDLSEKFMKEYLRAFPCMEGQKEKELFVYYKCYRANIRAKVNALRAMQADPNSEQNGHIKEVKQYLDLMRSYF